MKRVIFGILIFSAILTIGCDTNKSDNLEMYTGQYFNTSGTIKINTYNGFKLIHSKRINNKDGSVRMILDFDKPLK